MCKQGLLTALFNPKAAIFVYALFPQLINPNGGSLAIQIMVLATISNLIGLFIGALSFCSQSFQCIVHWNRKDKRPLVIHSGSCFCRTGRQIGLWYTKIVVTTGSDQIFDEIVNLISSLFKNQVNLVVGVYFKFYSVINTPQLTSLTQRRYIGVCKFSQ